MNNKIRLAWLFPIMLMTLLLTGCPDNSKKPVAMAVVWGIRSNQPIPTVNTVQKSLEDACESYGSITIVINDGSPHTLFTQDIENPGDLTEYALEQIKGNQIAQISNLLNTHAAVNPEADTLESIKLCIRELNSLTEEEPDAIKKLVIFDSGLSTAGYLNFASSQDYLHRDAEEVVDYLKANEALPHLDGIVIEWYLLGDTSLPQEKLSDAEKNNLRRIWQAIISAGGGSVTFKENTPGTGQWKDKLPDVTTVSSMLVYDETQIAFVKNKAVFLNEEEAVSVLKQLATKLKANPNQRKLICGTTATWGSQKSCEKLSLERANTVKRTLVKLGVNENQIVTIGLGFANDPWHYDDIDTNGHMIESQAIKNRRIVIIDRNSSMAKKLLP